jgi:hypothetical protein
LGVKLNIMAGLPNNAVVINAGTNGGTALIIYAGKVRFFFIKIHDEYTFTNSKSCG